MTTPKTPKTNIKKCSEAECLTVKIYKNHSRAFVYNVWNNKHFIGEIIEDNIMKLLDKGEMKKLNEGECAFRISTKKLRMAITKPNYIN